MNNKIEREVLIGKYVFIKNKNSINLPIENCVFSQIHFDNNNYYQTYINDEKNYYNFKCLNYKNNKCCNGSCSVHIFKNGQNELDASVSITENHSQDCLSIKKRRRILNTKKIFYRKRNL